MATAERRTTLIGLTDEVSELLAWYEQLLLENGGEVNEAVEAELDARWGSWQEKLERVLAARDRIQELADAAAARAKQLEELARSRQRTADDLTAYLMRCMRSVGRTEVDTAERSLKIVRAGTPSARWTGTPEEIPAELLKPWTPPAPPPPALNGVLAIERYRAWKRATDANEKERAKAAREGRAAVLVDVPELPEGVEYAFSERLQIR